VRLFGLTLSAEMPSYLLPEEVFVTHGFPEHTYVSIHGGKPERDLTEGLEQKNKIISIVGPSKSGKSTLCDKKFGRNNGVANFGGKYH
jgi:predicted ABC-class ATPase